MDACFAHSILTIDQLLATRSQVGPDPPQWSSDGGSLIFVSELSGRPELWRIAASGGFPERLSTGLGGVHFLGSRVPRLSPDGRWIACLAEEQGAASVWLWPMDGGAGWRLADLGAGINALNWSPDSQSLALSSNRHGAYNIYRVELADGQVTRLTTDPRYEVNPVFTPDGTHIVYVRLNEAWTDHDVVMVPARGGLERTLVCDRDFFDYGFGSAFGYPLISPNGQTLLFRSYRSGWLNYWRVSVEGGEPTPLCAEAADQSDAVWSPDGQRVAYCVNHDGTVGLNVAFIDGTAPQRLVAPTLGACSAPQWSPDGSRIAYLYQTPTAPLDLWIVSVQDGATRPLTHSLLSGAAQRLAVPEKVTYRTFDGLPIHAYLYKPPPSERAAKSPAIIWAHGGPASQWLDDFYSYIQYFAGEGYVVLTPNVRGSTGYGRPFEDLNNADFGYGDLQDVLAGVDYLKTLDDVDSGRMGITGTSYGGYLTAAAVCFAPGVFQAAVAASGYPDRVAMYYEQELRHIKQMEFKFGPFETHQHIYRKCSPLYWAKQATTPTFVLHGEGGLPRSSASRDFAQALEKEYKTVQYKAYPGEGYYVRSPANTRAMLLDMRAFFEKYL